MIFYNKHEKSFLPKSIIIPNPTIRARFLTHLENIGFINGVGGTLFGSVARGESGDESDVDIVIRISEPDFFMLAGIKEDLEKRLNKSIDIVTYTDSMNPFLKNKIDHEAVYA